jgi:hypothetical protein
MGPPADVVMGPPPPPLSATHQPPPALPKENQENVFDKYRKLKRKFFELEDVSSHPFIITYQTNNVALET